jgi:hypothetical protein
MGSLEVASTPILGAVGTAYAAAPFRARGLETNVGPNGPNDGYAIAGNMQTIFVGMRVTEPGDWIRVVTAANSVSEPGTMVLLGGGLLGLLGFRRKFRQ